MKMFKRVSALVVSTAVAMFVICGPITAFAATTPSLGAAATFGVLSSTYTNTLAGTINGDLGYTTPPDTATTVNGTTYVGGNGTYVQAGLDQATALASLNSQTATYTFPNGAINLSTDTTRGGTTGEYTAGVYVINGAASVGTAGITLNGEGTYIFRINGALDTVANSAVRLTGGASACHVFWTPTATTLGANSTFIGTDIDNAGITVGSTVTWTGRALDFATTVTTNNDTISVPTSCTTSSTPAADAAATAAATAASDAAAATAAAAAAAAKLPATGIAPSQNSALWNIAILSGILVLVSTSLVVVLRKRKDTI